MYCQLFIMGLAALRQFCVLETRLQTDKVEAKFKRECSVIEFDGKEVTDPSSLRKGTPPGRKVTLKIMRDGKMQKIDITIVELPSEMQKLQGKFDNLLKGVMVQGLLFLDTFLQIKYNKNFRTL